MRPGDQPLAGRRAGTAGPARRLTGPGLVAGAVAGGLALVHAVDPYRPGSYPVCPSLALTGAYCPGCGTLRMLHSLTEGDLAGALAMNPLGLLLVPVLSAGWLWWTWRAVRGHRGTVPLSAAAAWVFLAVMAAYTVARNLPAGAWLAPG
ncbi:MAG: DUF2752 domain-containing protein [Kineosporiaceae bacterium]